MDSESASGFQASEPGVPKPLRTNAPDRAARVSPSTVGELRPLPSLHAVRRSALIVDLNNFATFPTMAVGILAASLRNAGFDARVLSPLAYDVPAAEREHRETLKDHIARRIHLSTLPPFRLVRNAAREVRAWWLGRPHPRVLREAARALDAKPDVLLLSAYLQHHAIVREIAALAHVRGIPVVLGGPMFNVVATADAWRGIAGLVAIVGSEVDRVLPQIVEAVCTGGDLLCFDGVMLPDGRRSRPASPLRELDLAPMPDYTDFPWDRYRLRIVPVMTGRGCQWGRCSFCSDVVSASGRSFRTRSVDSVLDEMREQSRRHQTSNFLFLDIKLNSNPAMLRGIADNLQHHVHGAQWIGTVHVDQRKDNGLSPRDLRAAVASGMRRVSFGLESGSQRLLDSMDKGCTVEGNAQFIHHAHEAGLSVRCTMFKGFPGENAEDLELTAAFLRRHGHLVDRVRYNEFSLPSDTPVYEAVRTQPQRYPGIRVVHWNHRHSKASYVNLDSSGRAYRRAKARVLAEVFAINRRAIRTTAHAFDGMM